MPPPSPSVLRFPPARLLVVGGVASLVLVTALGLRLHYVRVAVGVDTRASAHVVHHHDGLLRDIVDLGSEGPIVVGVAAIAVWALARRDAAGLFVAVAGPAIAIVLAEVVLKPMIERRAPSGALSFPSGHVTAAASVAATALLLLFRYAGWRWAVAWSPVAAVFLVFIGAGVVELGWHYASDSVAGAALGIGIVLLIAAVADRVASRAPQSISRIVPTTTG